jgi:adenylate cyclase
VNSAGDSVLAEFASVVEAVNCAVEVQSGLRTENANLLPERRMKFRIGVNLGDVMVEGDQIYGDGVNVAARLESLADPGGICISNTVHDQVCTKLALNYADLGEQTVKNIAKPVRLYRVLLNGAPKASPATPRIPLKYRRVGALSFAELAIVIGTIVLVQHLSLKPQTTHLSIPPQEKPALPLPDIPSIAVLPFANLGGDPQQDYFSDGIADQLVNDLSRISRPLCDRAQFQFRLQGQGNQGAANRKGTGRQVQAGRSSSWNMNWWSPHRVRSRTSSSAHRTLSARANCPRPPGR